MVYTVKKVWNPIVGYYVEVPILDAERQIPNYKHIVNSHTLPKCLPDELTDTANYINPIFD